MSKLILLVTAMMLSSCMNFSVAKKVTYRVNGSTFAISYESPEGDVITTTGINSWQVKQTLNPGDRASIEAITHESPSGMSVQIYIDDKLWKQKGSDDANDTLFIDEKVPFFF